MKMSENCYEFEQAKELLTSMQQMQEYATEPEFVDAAIYFTKGCEMLIAGYVRLERNKGTLPTITTSIKTSNATAKDVMSYWGMIRQSLTMLGGELHDTAKKLFGKEGK